MFNKIVLNKVTFTVLFAVLFAMYVFVPTAQAQQQSTLQMQQLIQSLLQQVQALQAQLNQLPNPGINPGFPNPGVPDLRDGEVWNLNVTNSPEGSSRGLVRFSKGVCDGYTIDWGDGTVTRENARSGPDCARELADSVRETHRYNRNGIYEVTVTVRSSSPSSVSQSLRSSQTVNIGEDNDTSRNIPDLRITNAPLAGDGDRRIIIRFDRPSSCSVYSIDWGDGSVTEVPGAGNQDIACSAAIDRVRVDHKYAQTGRYTVTVSIPDSNQQETRRVRVNNDVSDLDIQTDSVTGRVTVAFTAPPCSGYVIRWGDGEETRKPTAPAGTACPELMQTVQETHRYVNSGRYVVTVNILETYQRSRERVNIDMPARTTLNYGDVSTTVTAIQNSLQQLTAAIR